jgi:ERCC4-type nuclease
MSSKIQKERTKGNIPAYRNPTPASDSMNMDITNTDTNTPDSLSNTLENIHISSSTIQSTPNVVPYCEVVHKVKKDNITPENIGEIILCTIPGISSTSAVEIMKQYDSFSHFMKEIESRPESLQEIYLTSNGKKRKLGKNIIENILRFLSPSNIPPKLISP